MTEESTNSAASFTATSNNATTNNDTILVVHCWSSPRSRSTAFMYSFDSRPDCLCLDEPLYYAWLSEKQDTVQRPYKDALLLGGEDMWQKERIPFSQRIHMAVESATDTLQVIFCKHMAKHYICYDFYKNEEKTTTSYVFPTKVTTTPITKKKLQHVHILLIRDPVAILTSWKASSGVHDGGNDNSSWNPEEVGTIPLMSIYSELYSYSPPVIVVDSDQLIASPKYTLQCLCNELKLSFYDNMLHWSSGPKECDGAWAKWWYESVHKTTGWNTTETNHSKKYTTLDPSMIPLLRICVPSHQFLKHLSIGTMKDARLKQIRDDLEDERNANIVCWIGSSSGEGGQLYPREMAGISPFDSAVQGGDAVWEGLRIYRGRILTCEEHINRLFRSAKAMGFQNVHTKDQIMEAIFTTLAANGMRDNAHIRLTLTRGVKCTSSMNPKFNLYGTTLIVLPEWKVVSGGKTTYDNNRGISLITASQRRNTPQTVDSKIHHNNLINNILPKIQANLVPGVADAIMLDMDGFVSETNATNIFMVDSSAKLLTPTADHCLPGITRATVIVLAKEQNIPLEERRLSLAEFHTAEEVFTTGTMGGITPVTCIDGRTIGSGNVGPITKRLQEIYATLPDRPGWSTILPEFSS